MTIWKKEMTSQFSIEYITTIMSSLIRDNLEVFLIARKLGKKVL